MIRGDMNLRGESAKVVEISLCSVIVRCSLIGGILDKDHENKGSKTTRGKGNKPEKSFMSINNPIFPSTQKKTPIQE